MGISSVSPASNEEHVLVTASVTVDFDGLVDHDLVDQTKFVLFAPGDTKWGGPWPDMKVKDRFFDYEPTEYNIIHGSFDKYDLSDGYSTPFTRIVFTPTRALMPFATFTIVIDNELVGGDDVYMWTFVTGDEDILSPPAAGEPLGATIVLGDTSDLSLSSTDVFRFSRGYPSDYAYDVPITTGTIILEFNNSIDPTTVDASKIVVSGEVADGHASRPSHGVVPATVAVVGNRIYLTLGGA